MWLEQFYYDKVGEVLLQARRSSSVTQQELARRLNKPQSFVSSYESGQRRLDIVEFITVADAINVDPKKLLRTIMDKFHKKG